MRKINIKITLILAAILIVSGFSVIQNHTRAQSPSISELSDSSGDSSDCGLLDGKEEDKCEKLEKKEEAYNKIIELKQKQEVSLDNQILLMKTEIESLEAEININKDKITELGDQIVNLEEKIIEKEELVKAQRRVLVELVRIYYEYNKQDIFAEITGSAITSAFMSTEDYVSQMGTKVGEILSSIKALKAGLESERNDIVSKKNKTIELKNDLEDKNVNLEASKSQKDRLLAETKGEEAKYKKLLRRVEEQKQDLLGDIDELYIENSAEINTLLKSLPKPSSKYRASTSWYYSQKDPRWGNKTIGNSKSLMKDFGCAIADVAMIFTYHGDKISPKTLAKKPIFSWDLIKWPLNSNEVVSGGNTTMDDKYGKYHGNISWSVIDKEIKKGNPVIVFIRAKGKAGHYVVIHNKDKKGRYVVHDPYFGPNIFLDSTIKLLSKMYDTKVSKSSIDQMILYK